MYKLSVLWPAMFLFGLFFLNNSTVSAWDPDYAYGLPKQRRMCARRDSPNTVHFFSIFSDEDCPKGSQRYIVVFGKTPKGSLAFLRSTTSQKFYPPLTLKWPPERKLSRNQLWHFTCVQTEEQEILGSKIRLYKYKGEITSKHQNECIEVEQRALKYCKEKLEGEELLEQCPIPWGQ